MTVMSVLSLHSYSCYSRRDAKSLMQRHKCDETTYMKYREIRDNQENKQKAKNKNKKTKKNPSSFFSIKMIAKLEWTPSSAQQNIEQLQNPTMGVTISNELTTTEPPP